MHAAHSGDDWNAPQSAPSPREHDQTYDDRGSSAQRPQYEPNAPPVYTDQYGRPMPPPAPTGAPTRETNLFAILSIIASGVGLVGVLPFVGPLAGIILGVLARKELEQHPEQGGKALADWGIILGVIGIVLWIFLFFLIALFAAIFGGGPWWWWTWWT